MDKRKVMIRADFMTLESPDELLQRLDELLTQANSVEHTIIIEGCSPLKKTVKNA